MFKVSPVPSRLHFVSGICICMQFNLTFAVAHGKASMKLCHVGKNFPAAIPFRDFHRYRRKPGRCDRNPCDLCYLFQHTHSICVRSAHGKRSFCLHHAVICGERDLIIRFFGLSCCKISHGDIFCFSVHVHTNLKEHFCSFNYQSFARNCHFYVL